MTETENTQIEKESSASSNSFLSGALRWLLTGLVAFGLGALVIIFALYLPARQKLAATVTALDDARATISDDADQISALKTENDILQNDLETMTLYRDVMEALSGVRGASLAIAADDYAGARLLLIQATEALDTLSGRVGTDQKDVFIAMQQSATRVLDSIQDDLGSAQAELDQLVNNLVQLEDNLFPDP